MSCRIFLQSANLGRAPRVLSRPQRRSFTLHKRALGPSGLVRVRACSLDGESEDGAKLSRCFAPQTGDHFPAAPFRDLRLGVHCVQAAHCGWLKSPSDGAPKGDLVATRLSQGDGVSVFFTWYAIGRRVTTMNSMNYLPGPRFASKNAANSYYAAKCGSCSVGGLPCVD